MNKQKQWISSSYEETLLIGKEIGAQLKQGAIVCFFGDLGAGKTSLIKGIVAGISDLSPHVVNSPTFVYLNIYHATFPIFHFDLYRLKNAEEFLSMGFEEMLFSEGVCLIEWPERISELFPSNILNISLIEKNGCREITLLGL